MIADSKGVSFIDNYWRRDAFGSDKEGTNQCLAAWFHPEACRT